MLLPEERVILQSYGQDLRRARAGAARRALSTIEVALALPLFLWLLCGIVDLGRLFYTHMTLQFAMREAGRFAVTGRHLPDGSGGTYSRVDSILQVCQAKSGGIITDPAAIDIWSTAGGSGSAGGPGDTVTISMTHGLDLVTPLVGSFFSQGRYVFTVATSFRNEPFPPGQTN